MLRKSNFTSLQKHIEDLTEEKLELKKTLELSERLTESLSKENEAMGIELNEQSNLIESLNKTIREKQNEMQVK